MPRVPGIVLVDMMGPDLKVGPGADYLDSLLAVVDGCAGMPWPVECEIRRWDPVTGYFGPVNLEELERVYPLPNACYFGAYFQDAGGPYPARWMFILYAAPSDAAQTPEGWPSVAQ